MRDSYVKFLKFLLPILFILYMGNIISFTHVHIINGVTIVHSHPYKSDSGSSGHQHTGSELQLLHQLSTIQQTGSCSFDYVLRSYDSYVVKITAEPVSRNHTSKLDESIQLRAPPFIG